MLTYEFIHSPVYFDDELYETTMYHLFILFHKVFSPCYKLLILNMIVFHFTRFTYTVDLFCRHM